MRRDLLLPLIIACALFMENMDSTVIATSLPVIAADLGVNPISLKLALTAYLVSLAVFIPISGWMADRFGSKTVFRLAIGVFMLGSLLCGLSSSLGGFVAARFLQGLGGAMMVPVGRLVLLKSVPKKDLVRVLSYLTIPALLGPVIGPPLGGAISTYFHWRWIFFINLPIGLLGIYLATRHVPQITEDRVAPLDAAGFLLSGIGLSAMTLGLATTGEHLLSRTASLGCLAAGVAALAAYLWHARRCAHPLIDFRFLRLATYRTGVLGGALFRVGVGAMPFLLPLMLQLGFGFSALASGMLTCTSALAAMFMKTLAVAILRRFGFRAVLTANVVVAAGTIAGYGLFTATTPWGWMVALLLAGGFFRSLQFTALNALSYADVARADMSPASSLANVTQQLALSLGVTLAAWVLESTAALRGHAQVEASDFSIAFVVVALVSASSFLFNIRLARNAGAEVAGRDGA
ncbi:MAG: MFS transporter [Burkholderiales bacterium]|nr:MFS transporter [Burkholderiales bacterium]